jgi:hypothetical protein
MPNDHCRCGLARVKRAVARGASSAARLTLFGCRQHILCAAYSLSFQTWRFQAAKLAGKRRWRTLQAKRSGGARVAGDATTRCASLRLRLGSMALGSVKGYDNVIHLATLGVKI